MARSHGSITWFYPVRIISRTEIDETIQLWTQLLYLVAVKFFSKGATTGIGFDSQLMREIGSLPPEKVTISLLISAQVNRTF